MKTDVILRNKSHLLKKIFRDDIGDNLRKNADYYIPDVKRSVEELAKNR